MGRKEAMEIEQYLWSKEWLGSFISACALHLQDDTDPTG